MDEKLRSVMCDVLGLAPAQYHDGLRSVDVPAWDSVLHLSLMLSVEQTFGVSFEPDEAQQLTSVSAIKAALAKKAVS